jgi:hypothetical protein
MVVTKSFDPGNLFSAEGLVLTITGGGTGV